MSQNEVLGDSAGGITLDGGELVGTGNFSTGRSVTLTDSNGTLAAAAAGSASFSGNLTAWELDHWGYFEHRNG